MTGLWARLSLAAKIFTACTCMAVAASSVGNVLLYREASGSLRDELRQRLEAVASTIACQVEPDLHRQIRIRADENSLAYRHIKSLLLKAMQVNRDIRYVYTMRPTAKPSTWVFVVDPEQDPSLVSHVGDTYDVSKLPDMRAGLIAPSADHVASKDKWGKWLSGYAPIKDRNGRVEGIVGIDMSARQLAYEESGMRHAAVVNAIICLALAIALGLGATRSAMKLLRDFTGAAERVRKGDLDFQLNVSRADEIGTLGHTFNEMISGLREGRERLLEASSMDLLTGLSNHVGFHERLSYETERAAVQGSELCVVLLDIDRFSLINDAYGYEIGNGLVQQVADVLRKNARKFDIVARYGGDDFAIILPDTGVEEGRALAEHLRATVESHTFHNLPPGINPVEGSESSGGGVPLTVTIGAACFPHHHSTPEGVLMAADVALCQAQHAGRNSVSMFDPHASINEGVDPEDLYQALRNPSSAALQALAAAVDARDKYTQGHSERVTQYSVMIGESAGVDRDTAESLLVAGLLHDLGKIGIPDAILNKPARLTDDERAIIEGHPSLGESILRRARQLEHIIPAVLHHHERWDGGGYPEGLAGEEIPFLARILAIADAYDAMTTDRPYREALTVEAALEEVRAGAGRQFDPVLADVFIRSMLQETFKLAA